MGGSIHNRITELDLVLVFKSMRCPSQSHSYTTAKGYTGKSPLGGVAAMGAPGGVCVGCVGEGTGTGTGKGGGTGTGIGGGVDIGTGTGTGIGGGVDIGIGGGVGGNVGGKTGCGVGC